VNYEGEKISRKTSTTSLKDLETDSNREFLQRLKNLVANSSSEQPIHKSKRGAEFKGDLLGGNS